MQRSRGDVGDDRRPTGRPVERGAPSTGPSRHQDVFRECVEDLDRRGLRRRPRIVGAGERAGVATIDDSVDRMKDTRIDFTSNDYLGLSTHPLVRQAIAKAALECGTWRSSPVVGGYSVYHRELELALVALKKTEECMLFSSGFAANVGVMTSLARLGYAFFSDELNHASLIDGMRMGRNREENRENRYIYRHSDLGHLEELLVASCSDEKKAVVTDRLFSMDGDFCDLKGLLRLQRRFGFLLVVDEAHSTLVVDDDDYDDDDDDEIKTINWPNDDVIRLGTLSKAVRAIYIQETYIHPLDHQTFSIAPIKLQVGQTGGFVCCTRVIRDALFNLARTFVYSTALSVPTVAGARVAIELGTGQEGHRRRAWLWRAVRACGGRSQILLLPTRDEATLEAIREQMEAEGARVGAIRPPTVANCRVRMSLCFVEGVEPAEMSRWWGRCAALCGCSSSKL